MLSPQDELVLVDELSLKVFTRAADRLLQLEGLVSKRLTFDSLNKFTLWWPSEAMGGHCGHLKPAEDNVAFWSRGQQQGRTKPPRLQPSQDLTWRTDRQQRHGAAWFGARPGTQAAKHWLLSLPAATKQAPERCPAEMCLEHPLDLGREGTSDSACSCVDAGVRGGLNTWGPTTKPAP
ncbi:hypothetical protein Anapl_03973 [Anas platyrhynchos]|uniref:Uncharacterized protein n=1 Tax=Anas platyrhynchos TaxID=8839 RepID=R0KEW9_ANAPL|nr:hypothetical protein Anapl_03973 [Anas platyrhynchos]